MGFARVSTTALLGVEAQQVDVEIHVGRGLPAFDIVGLPEGSVMEGRKRIRAAILSSGLEFPIQKITVNLAPADFKKGGARFDLPIALGILAASDQLPPGCLRDSLFVGELALDGALRPARGEMATLILAEKKAFQCFFTARHIAADASQVRQSLPGKYEFVNLAEAVNALRSDTFVGQAEPLKVTKWLCTHLANHAAETAPENDAPGLEAIEGQLLGKRAIAIAAAGFHSLFMFGPPGVGKSLLARALVGLLPPLNVEEAVEILKIQSASLPQHSWQFTRPFRTPHHSTSLAGMLGRQQGSLPGEMALAHRGVLFLDEFGEFRRDVLEALREPLEVGQYKLSRTWGEVTYPSRFMLVAAMNPCPCGFHGDPQRDCRCSAGQIRRYQNRLSAPMLDRFDMSLGLQRQTLQANAAAERTTTRDRLHRQIANAVAMQLRRYQTKPYQFNAQLPANELHDICNLSSNDATFVQQAAEKLQLSYRAYHRILRVARTIADLEAAENVQQTHILEALQYRQTMIC